MFKLIYKANYNNYLLRKSYKIIEMTKKTPIANQNQTVSFNPFAGPTIEKVIHTTASQAEIWLGCALGGEDANRGYNESVSLILKGELNKIAIESAIQNLVKQHESLRSTFSSNGQFMTIFNELPIFPLYQDISNLTTSEKENKITNYLFGDANYIFNLLKGPLIKVSIIKLSEAEHQLVITAHHIICDGWSMGIILEDIGRFYNAHLQNKTSVISKPESFSSYADEQQEFIESEGFKTIQEYWLKQYESSVPKVTLPTDFPRPKIRTFKSNRLDFPISNDLVSDLKKVGIQSGASFVVTLMTAFEVFLHFQTGQEDLVIGLSAAGQSVSGKNHLVGHCVNLLPLRSKITLNTPFNTYLRSRKNEILDAYEHQQFSFGQLLQKLNVARDLSRVPLVPVTFNIDMGMANDVVFNGLSYKLKSNPRTFETFELFLNATGTEDELILEWSYNTSLFKTSTIEQMMTSFKGILHHIVENPSNEISNIIRVDNSASSKPINTDKSTPNIMFKETTILTNVDFIDYTEGENIIDLFLSQVKKSPNNIAIAFEAKKITYKELDILSNQFANYIINSHNVRVNDLVSVMLERSEWIIVCVIGILKSGAAYVPIDPDYPEKRKNYIINDSLCKITIDSGFLTNFINEIDKLSPELNNSIKILPESLCYVIYTSGSTGNPKGVMNEHRRLLNYLLSSSNYINKESDTSGCFAHLSLSFDASITEIFLPLINGKSLILSSGIGLSIFEDSNLFKYAPYDFIKLTPSHIPLLTTVLKNNSNKNLAAKYIIGGEALYNYHIEHFKTLNINALIVNEYGPTEATVGCCINEFEISSSSNSNESISIGLPIANTQIYILDQNLELLPKGEIGELYIAGKGLARGYLNRPELTKERFIPDIFNEGERMYRSGDHAKWLPNGEIEFVGRIDDQVKIRGYRIELMEVEAALNSLPNIKRSVVTTTKNFDGELSIVAYLQPIKTQSDSNTVKNQLRQIMPEFQIPSGFMWVEGFPLTTNGKIERNNLLKFAPDTINTGFTAPSSASEKIIESIWKDVLGLEKIDVDSDFFEIGGHSLLGVKVMTILEKETGKRLPLVGLLKHPTIKKFAAYMDSEFFAWDSLVLLKSGNKKPPLYIVHGANHQVLIFDALAQYLDKDQPVYGLQSRGLDGNSEPHDSIDDMAADYIKEIVVSNPTGPYALAGFSYGGIVAYEMARQLRAQGKKVTIMAQFDTYVVPEYYFKNPIKKKVISVGYLTGKMVYLLCNMFSSKKNFIRRTDLLKLKLKGWYLRLKHGKEKQYEEQFNVSSKMYDNHNIATSRYTITPQDIVIDLFRADEEVNFVHDHKFLGWSKMAGKGIRKHMVVGNHVDMFEKPHVKDFADKLQHVLDKHNLDTYE